MTDPYMDALHDVMGLLVESAVKAERERIKRIIETMQPLGKVYADYIHRPILLAAIDEEETT